jgi:hypothetical protein
MRLTVAGCTGNKTNAGYLLSRHSRAPRFCSSATAMRCPGNCNSNSQTQASTASGLASSSPRCRLDEPAFCKAQMCFWSAQSMATQAANSAASAGASSSCRVTVHLLLVLRLSGRLALLPRMAYS